MVVAHGRPSALREPLSIIRGFPFGFALLILVGAADAILAFHAGLTGTPAVVLAALSVPFALRAATRAGLRAAAPRPTKRRAALASFACAAVTTEWMAVGVVMATTDPALSEANAARPALVLLFILIFGPLTWAYLAEGRDDLRGVACPARERMLSVGFLVFILLALASLTYRLPAE